MEYFDICDSRGMPTGQIVERSVCHRDGVPHRTVHIWLTRIKDGRRQILLQKRSMNKDSFPGMYDTSSAGHIQAGDEPLESALRELEEELGIHAGKEDLAFAGTFHADYEKVFHQSIFHDNEYVNLFVYRRPVDIEDITIQQEELDGVEWFDLEEVEQECQSGKRDRFCVPLEGLAVLKHYLEQENI